MCFQFVAHSSVSHGYSLVYILAYTSGIQLFTENFMNYRIFVLLFKTSFIIFFALNVLFVDSKDILLCHNVNQKCIKICFSDLSITYGQLVLVLYVNGVKWFTNGRFTCVQKRQNIELNYFLLWHVFFSVFLCKKGKTEIFDWIHIF